MNKYDYPIYPILALAFLKVAIGFTMELAVPLYYIGEGYEPLIVGILSSATSMAYLFSPLLLKNVPEKIGIKNSLLISAIGGLGAQFIIQFTLNPWIVYFLLFSDGIFTGLFWPVIITAISLISNSDNVCDDIELQDSLMKSYNISWNAGAIFSYSFGTIVLFIIVDIILIFRFTFLFSIGLFIFGLLMNEPRKKAKKEEIILVDSDIKDSCMQEEVVFSKYSPLFYIALYSFFIGAILILYPLKSETLQFPLYSNFLFNLLRMTAQTVSVFLVINLPLSKLKSTLYLSLAVLTGSFIVFGLNSNLLIFGTIFALFGLFGSILYTASFKLVIYLNIDADTSKYSTYFETLSSFGFFISPIIMGGIAEVDLSFSFYLLAIMAFGAFITIIFTNIRSKSKNTYT